MNFNLKEKNILITGAAGLLGQQFTNSLVKQGANCYLVDINKTQSNSNIKKNVHKFNVDLTNPTELEILKSKLDKKNIFIDTLINNAAYNPKPGQNLNGLWEKDLELSLTSVKNIIELFAIKMKKKKLGNIINIGSDLSVIAPDQRIYSHMNYKKPLSYSVVKHGILGITKYYAACLASYNIRVNCLSPGGIYNKQDKKFVKKIKQLIPLNRMANFDEYNGAIVFMCGDESRYMTGHNLIIDGGRSII